jgi:hypothetical protein
MQSQYRNVVATAAHRVYGTQSNGYPLGTMGLRAGLRRRSSRVERRGPSRIRNRAAAGRLSHRRDPAVASPFAAHGVCRARRGIVFPEKIRVTRFSLSPRLP